MSNMGYIAIEYLAPGKLLLAHLVKPGWHAPQDCRSPLPGRPRAVQKQNVGSYFLPTLFLSSLSSWLQMP